MKDILVASRGRLPYREHEGGCEALKSTLHKTELLP